MKTKSRLFGNVSKAIAVLSIGLCWLAPAQAHRSFLVPSSTVLDASDKQWVTIDAARGNDLFFFNHNAMPIDGLQIIAPDGRVIPPAKLEKFRYRTVFDIQLNQQGTWKTAVIDEGLRARWKEDGNEKRWNGSRNDYAKSIPDGAKELSVTEVHSRVETYVTVGKPTKSALTGKGLEVEYQTHPNDMFVGDNATLVFHQNGTPASNVKVTLIRGGVRYRNQPNEEVMTTDAQGRVQINFKQAGMYWLNASVKSKGVSPASAGTMSYVATLEVLEK